MRKLILISFLLKSSLIFGQYTIDRIYYDNGFSDTLLLKTGTDSLFRSLGGGNYEYVLKTRFKRFVEAENITGAVAQTQVSNLVSDLTGKLATNGNGSSLTGLTKSQVGLANADNTSDANKPVSNAVQSALDLKAPIASPTFTGTVGGITKSMVGLGNVDNTSDASKPVSTATQTALNAKQNSLPSIVGQGNKFMRVNAGATDYEYVTIAGGGDLLAANNLSDVANAATARTNLGLTIGTNVLAPNGNGSALTGLTASQVGLGNVTNESKATMFTSPTFTGTPVVPGYLPNTTTSGVGSSPTASSTTTVTHSLGRVPTTIRIYGYGTFTSNAAATATTSSMGVFTSSGNHCVYQRFGAAITTTQAGLSSNAFAILLATGGGNFISGVIQNVTGTSFDIVWTETGTATAQVYLWEAQ